MIEFFYNVVKLSQVVVFIFGAYQFWASRRERLAADKVREAQERLDSNYQAWLVVNSAQGKGGSGGRIDALANLVRQKQSLAGVNLDGAWLVGVNLRGADLANASLKDANLQGAILSGANMKSANLDGANFTAAQLDGALLQGAFVVGTRLSAANLTRADLAELVGWEEIASVNYAKLDEVLRAPRGFREWALSKGAEGGEAAAIKSGSERGFSEQFRAM